MQSVFFEGKSLLGESVWRGERGGRGGVEGDCVKGSVWRGACTEEQNVEGEIAWRETVKMECVSMCQCVSV